MDQARSDEELAAAMYGGEPPSVHIAATDSIARTVDQIATEIHDKPEPLAEELPPEVQALRDADLARQVYDDRTQYAAAGIDKALGELGIEGQAADLAHREWAGAFADMGMDAQDAAQVVAVAMVDEPTDEQVEAWRGEAEAALQETYGADDWQQALSDARLLVKRDPRVKDFLNRTGLGSHPTVVKLAAQRARALIASGQLKRN